MTERLDSFKDEFYRIVSECEPFLYAARAREFQIEAIEQLEALKASTSALKAQVIVDEDEDSANQLLSLEETLNGLIYELKMWVAFKDDDPHAAWTALVESQGAIRTAMQAHNISGHLENWVKRLYAIEHLLFPPQMFFSAGTIVKRSTCSICGQEYGDCEHVKGRAYMGEMCCREIQEFDLNEVSVVENPANKHCRVLRISDGDAMRDFMTWRLVPATQPIEDPEDALRRHILSDSTKKKEAA